MSHQLGSVSPTHDSITCSSSALAPSLARVPACDSRGGGRAIRRSFFHLLPGVQSHFGICTKGLETH